MKKKIVMSIMVASMLAGLCACTGSNAAKDDNKAQTSTEKTTEHDTQNSEMNATEKASESATEYTEKNTEKDTEKSSEKPADTQNSEADDSETEKSGYSAATDKSDAEVEDFAKKITEDFKNKDWQSLAEKISYPITINEKYYADKDKFTKNDWSKEFSDEFIDNVAKAKTSDLFCNWSGIMLDDGSVWFVQDGDKLVISAINYNDGNNKPDSSSGIVGHFKLDMNMTEKNLKNYSSLQEMFGTGIQLGGSMSINEDNTFSMSLALEQELSGTYDQDENVINVKAKDESGNEEELTMSFETIDGTFYIKSECSGESIYWTKLAE